MEGMVVRILKQGDFPIWLGEVAKLLLGLDRDWENCTGSSGTSTRVIGARQISGDPAIRKGGENRGSGIMAMWSSLALDCSGGGGKPGMILK